MVLNVDRTKLCVNFPRDNFLNIFLLERVERQAKRTRLEMYVGGVNETWKRRTRRDLIARCVVLYGRGLFATKWKLKIRTLACLRSGKPALLSAMCCQGRARKPIPFSNQRIQLTELRAQSIRVEASLGEALKRLQLVVGASVGVGNFIFILDVASIHDGTLLTQFPRLCAEKGRKSISKLELSFCLHFSIQGMHSHSSQCVVMSLFPSSQPNIICFQMLAESA